MIFAISRSIYTIVAELVNKFPASFGIRVSVTVFIRGRDWALSWARQIEYVSPHPVSLRSVLLLYSLPSLSSDFFPSDLPAVILCAFRAPPFSSTSSVRQSQTLLSYVLIPIKQQIVYFLANKVKDKPVTVVERSKTCTVFARSEAGIVGSNPTHKAWMFGMCMCLFCV
jgi:hypothetical protein